MPASNMFLLIFLTVIYHRCIFLQQIGVNGIQIIPLWTDFNDDNRTSSCTIDERNDNRVVYVHGIQDTTCRVEITAQTDHLIRIQVPSLFSEDDFLYVEKLGHVLFCPYRYIVITANSVSCSSTFSHEKITLSMKSNERLFITEEQRSQDDKLCPSFDKNVGVGLDKVCSLIAYNKRHTCIFELGGVLNTTKFCRFDLQPDNCSVSIQRHEVTTSCPSVPYDVSLIEYPDEMVELDLSSNNITNISANAFTDLYDLKGLRLYNNSLVSIQSGVFDSLQNLKILLLNGTELDTLSEELFSKLAMLTHLDLSNNKLQVLPNVLVRNLLNLEVLLIDNNSIDFINVNFFNSLEALQELDLSKNNISNLDDGIFDQLSSLHILRLSGNNIATISRRLIQGLTNLTVLSIDSNSLTSLPTDLFVGLNNLNELNFAHNNISYLDNFIFKGLDDLNMLNLENNSISEISFELFQSLNILQSLSLGYNKLDALNTDVFQSLTNVSTLSLNHNLVSYIPEDIFSNNGNLSELYLHNNTLEKLENDTFKGLNNLTILSLQNNNLTGIPVGLFRELYNLKELRLSGNQIKDLENSVLQDLYNLTYLNINHNFLTGIPYNLFHGLDRLVRLNIQSNFISTLDNRVFRGLHSLEYLRLTNNSLIEIPHDIFQGGENLRSIALRGNQLTSLPVDIFQGLDNLENLFLHHNNFDTMPVGIFGNLPNLKLLRLNENEFNAFEVDIFQNLTNLTFLDISANHLNDIPKSSVLSQLTIFGASHNPLLNVNSRSFSSLTNKTKLLVSQNEICQCLVPKGVDCIAEEDRSPYLTCDRLLKDRMLVGVMWLIGLNAFIGNLFVLIWKQRHSDKPTVQNILLSNLAMSDFLMGVYMIIIGSADVYFGENFLMSSETCRSGVTCKIASTLVILSSEASVFFVTLISIERFMCIKFPTLERKNRVRNMSITVFVSWILALTLSIVPSVLAGRNFKFYDNSHVCIGLPLSLLETFSKHAFPFVQWEKTSFWLASSYSQSEGLEPGLYYSTALFLGLNCLCFLLICVCYIEIVRTIKVSFRNSGGSFMADEIRMTLKVTAIVATDFCCWFPIIILGILVQTQAITLPPHTYAWLVTCVLPINSAINPYLYTIADIVSTYRKEKREGSAQAQENSITREVHVNNNLEQTKI